MYSLEDLILNIVSSIIIIILSTISLFMFIVLCVDLYRSINEDFQYCFKNEKKYQVKCV